MKSASLWMGIHLTMPDQSDMQRGMDIATKFEDRHGGHPPMCFELCREENAIRLTVFTHHDKKSLRRMVRDAGAVRTQVYENGTFPRERCHIYQAAKQLDGKPSADVKMALTWLHDMLGYTRIDSAIEHQEMATWLLHSTFKRRT